MQRRLEIQVILSLWILVFPRGPREGFFEKPLKILRLNDCPYVSQAGFELEALLPKLLSVPGLCHHTYLL